MASAGIRLQGDWRKLRSKFERYTYAGEHMAEVTMAELAEFTREKLHEVVNSSPSPRNAPKTVKNKGFDNPLYETGGFMEDDSIVVLEDKSNGETIFTIQGNPDKENDRSGTTYETIVAVNSSGGGHIPARDMLPIAFNLCEPELKSYARKSLNDWLREG